MHGLVSRLTTSKNIDEKWLTTKLFSIFQVIYYGARYAELLISDAIGLGLSIMGQSWDTLIGGENVNRRPKMTPSTWTAVINH